MSSLVMILCLVFGNQILQASHTKLIQTAFKRSLGPLTSNVYFDHTMPVEYKTILIYYLNKIYLQTSLQNSIPRKLIFIPSLNESLTTLIPSRVFSTQYRTR